MAEKKTTAKKTTTKKTASTTKKPRVPARGFLFFAWKHAPQLFLLSTI